MLQKIRLAIIATALTGAVGVATVAATPAAPEDTVGAILGPGCC